MSTLATTYALAKRVRSKLERDAVNPRTELLRLVVQANMYEDLSHRIRSEVSTMSKRIQSTSQPSTVSYRKAGEVCAAHPINSSRDEQQLQAVYVEHEEQMRDISVSEVDMGECSDSDDDDEDEDYAVEIDSESDSEHFSDSDYFSYSDSETDSDYDDNHAASVEVHEIAQSRFVPHLSRGKNMSISTQINDTADDDFYDSSDSDDEGFTYVSPESSTYQHKSLFQTTFPFEANFRSGQKLCAIPEEASNDGMATDEIWGNIRFDDIKIRRKRCSVV